MENEERDLENTPPDIVQKASDVSNNCYLASREKYEIAYKFMDWRIK